MPPLNGGTILVQISKILYGYRSGHTVVSEFNICLFFSSDDDDINNQQSKYNYLAAEIKKPLFWLGKK